MFGAAFRVRFHQSGLSLPYLRAYSSLHRLCGVQLLICSLDGLRRKVNQKFSPFHLEISMDSLCFSTKDEENRRRAPYFYMEWIASDGENC